MKRSTLVIALLILSAVSISGAAAFFSVYGLSKVFAGASLAVTIMASILEASKLITAYVLHQDTAKFSRVLKIYLGVAVGILMLITSAGIYGFLSSAYQQTASRNGIVEKEISVIELKKTNLEERLASFQTEKESAIQDINQLRNGLSTGTTTQYIDKKTGQVITSSSSSARKSLENQLQDATTRRDQLNEKIEAVSEEINLLTTDILEKQLNNEAAAELGPLLYLSSLTGLSMDLVMNYFILMIIFVFDPLAITLVIATSHTVNYYSRLKTEEEEKEDRRVKRRVRLYGTEEAPKRGRPQAAAPVVEQVEDKKKSRKRLK
jgi:chromosome segregation ATPase